MIFFGHKILMWRVAVLIFLIPLGMYIGYILGVEYFNNVIPFLPLFLRNFILNFFLIGGGISFVFDIFENKYLWGYFMEEKKTEVGKYDPAPISLGMGVGFLSVWIINQA